MTSHSKIIVALRGLRALRNSFRSVAKLRAIDDLDGYLTTFRASSLGVKKSSSLDIGCGDRPRNPFQAHSAYGIDIRDNAEQNVTRADLTVEPIPFPDETFDFITAYDFIEHVPRLIYLPRRRFPFVELMNEIWRTLKADGIFLSHTPIFPYAEAFQDPTHVNILTTDTYPFYFDDQNRWASIYGYRGAFKIVDQCVRPPHLISVLQKRTG
jgi:SAM-dependent methyltransferase